MLRKDGDITIYILKHVYPDDVAKRNEEWKNSGECAGFKRQGKVNRDAKHFNALTACGDCWQQYGIHGSFKAEDVFKAAQDMSKEYPNYHWGVFEVKIKQTTVQRASFLAEKEHA